MTFTLMTDSTADLCPSWADDHNIVLMGLTITCDGKVYETVGPDRLRSDSLLEKMKAGSHPQTSQIMWESLRQFSGSMRSIKSLFCI